MRETGNQCPNCQKHFQTPDNECPHCGPEPLFGWYIPTLKGDEDEEDDEEGDNTGRGI